jgi:hypothetical protein
MRYLFLLFLFLPFGSFSQNKYKQISSILTEADFFTTDNQCNIYVVKKNELVKYDKSGKQLCKYSNKNFGNISYVDASNMLKVLVFCKEFSQIIFLDNTLSANGEPVSFDKIGLQQVSLVCSSFNNGMWIYNQQNFALTQLNTLYQVEHHTENLNNLLNINFQPIEMLEHDNRIYINNPSSGVLIFDIYGTYYKTVPVKNAKQIQIIGDWIYFMLENSVHAYNTKTTEETEFSVPETNFSSFRLEVETLFLRTEKGISVYAAE